MPNRTEISEKPIIQTELDGENWFVIQTKVREEDRALFHLQEKDVEVYLPMLEAMLFHARRRRVVHKPLFPSYLFARFDAGNMLDKVRWTKGVVRILLDSVHPVPLSDEIIEGIKSMEGEDGIIRPRPSQDYKRVRITRGPFKDMTGVIDRRLSDSERVKILLDMVSYHASVEVHPSIIEGIA